MNKINKIVKNALNKIIYNSKSPKWTGTQADLMEIVYVLYLSGKLVDQSGRKLKLIDITKFVFKMFGCKPPKNPSRVLKTIRKRAKPEELSVVYLALCDLYLKNFGIKI